MFFKIDNSFTIKDLGPHNGLCPSALCLDRKQTFSCYGGLANLPTALVTFRIMTSPELFSPAKNSHLSSRQIHLAVYGLQCLVHVHHSIPKPVTCCFSSSSVSVPHHASCITHYPKPCVCVSILLKCKQLNSVEFCFSFMVRVSLSQRNFTFHSGWGCLCLLSVT